MEHLLKKKFFISVLFFSPFSFSFGAYSMINNNQKHDIIVYFHLINLIKIPNQLVNYKLTIMTSLLYSK